MRHQDIEVTISGGSLNNQMGPSLKTFEGPFSQQFLLIQQHIITDVIVFSF